MEEKNTTKQNYPFIKFLQKVLFGSIWSVWLKTINIQTKDHDKKDDNDIENILTTPSIIN